MKTIIKFVILISVLLFATQCLAQFGNTNGTKFPYTNGVSRNDVFIIGTPGVTNKNIAASNMLSAIDGIANPASLKLATNGSLVTGPINILIGSNVLSASAASNAVVIGVNTAGNVIGDGTIFISGGSASGGADTGGIGIGYGVGAGINAVTIGTQNDNFSIQGASVGFGGATSGKWVNSIGANNNSDTVTNVIMIGHDLAVTSNNVAIYGGADILRSFIAGTVVASNYTGNAAGLTNIANANVVKAGTGITITTNTTAGTGTKEFTVALSGSGAGTNLWMQKDGSNWTNALNADIIWSSAGPTSQQLTLGANDYINNGAQRWRASPGLEVGTGTYAIQGSGTSGGLSEGDGSMRVWHTVSNYVSGGITAGTINATTLNITTANVTNMVSAGSQTNGFLYALANGTVAATNNGIALTNLNYRFLIYSNNTGTVTPGQVMFTNISGNISLKLGAAAAAGFNDWAKVIVTNTTSTDYKVTLEASVTTATNAFVVGQDVYVTNKSKVHLMFDIGPDTNCAAIRFQR